MFAYNLVIMRKFGADGVTAFTIVGYTAFVFSMVIVGFGQGASPLLGALGLSGYLLQTFFHNPIAGPFTLGISSGAKLVVALVMVGISGWYGSIFVANRQVQDMVNFGIRIFVVSFFFSGINAITSFYFTAIGKAFESAVISSLRGLVVLLLCIFILPALFGMTGVWMAAPVTELVTLGATGVFLRRDREKMI